MSFVHLKSERGRAFYVAADLVAEVDAVTETVVLKDGRRLKAVEYSSIERLIGGGLIRGVTVEDGALVCVPVGAIDHVTDTFDEVAGEWLSIATTLRGIRFAVDPVGRAALGMDDETFAVEELRAAGARLRGDAPGSSEDVEADAAVAAAQEAAGGVRAKKVRPA